MVSLSKMASACIARPQVELPCPPDNCLHVGDKVCLLHVPSKALVSAYMSAGQAYEAQQIEPSSQLSCSQRLEPCSRNVFVIGRLVGHMAWTGRVATSRAIYIEFNTCSVPATA